MTLKKSEKRLLVILGIAVTVFLFDQFILGGGDEEEETLKTGAAVAKNLLKPSAVNITNTAQMMSQAQSTFVRKRFDDWGRDPFALPKPVSTGGRISGKARQRSEEETEKNRPKLQGFLWKRGKAYVLIDDSILTEGEEKDGLRVERIRDQEVLCSQEGRTFTLYWRESQ